MNAKKAKALRRRAKAATQGLPEESYIERKTHPQYVNSPRQKRLGECTKGAYKALKSGRFVVRNV